jgi:hypothetical protein
MKRFASVIGLSVVLLMAASLVQGSDVTPGLDLKKGCVVFGRLDGHMVRMELTEAMQMTDLWLPKSAAMKDFVIINPASGIEHALELTQEGYFCAALVPGSYELRTPDNQGNWIIIDSFEVPRGRLVNLGTYRVEMKSTPFLNDWAWHPCTIGPYKRSVRFNHMQDEAFYSCCEEWFASIIYGQLAGLPLRN